jgi:zinc/manganese transport system substrate-binding protein
VVAVRCSSRAGARCLVLLGATLLLAWLPACSSSSGAAASSRVVRVAAAENVWGSIASQLGGVHAQVVSIIRNPNTDPHDYEPTAADGRTIAAAQLVIENGLGYDPWAAQLVAANETSGQQVIDVGARLGLEAGDNPHRWYFPEDVDRVIDAVTKDFQGLDPADAAYFARQRQQFETTTLAPYHALIASIRSRYAGTPVGASESIFEGLAQATGLDLLTPDGYLKAISEGTDPTAADKATVDAQIAGRKIDVWVVNSQNATPDVQVLTNEARGHGIAVTTITETLSPASTSFQDWQAHQLQALQHALAEATGR